MKRTLTSAILTRPAASVARPQNCTKPIEKNSEVYARIRCKGYRFLFEEARDHTVCARGDRGSSAGEIETEPKTTLVEAEQRGTRWAWRPARYLYGAETWRLRIRAGGAVTHTPYGLGQWFPADTRTIVSWPLRWAGWASLG
jgi:hypothetical protein